jgi:hypothetical protein
MKDVMTVNLAMELVKVVMIVSLVIRVAIRLVMKGAITVRVVMASVRLISPAQLATLRVMTITLPHSK